MEPAAKRLLPKAWSTVICVGMACVVLGGGARGADMVPTDVQLPGTQPGEVLRDADKFFGATVILAARIAAQAAGGEILASSLLKELTESVGDLRFGAEREVALKGFVGTHRVFPVQWS